ncbi:hypothetical protein D3C73_1284620 [compost metagenome]
MNNLHLCTGDLRIQLRQFRKAGEVEEIFLSERVKSYKLLVQSLNRNVRGKIQCLIFLVLYSHNTKHEVIFFLEIVCQIARTYI